MAFTKNNNCGVVGNFPDWDVASIADAIIDRMEDTYKDEDDLCEGLNSALNDELIYTADQWTVLAGYCTPQEADWNEAIEAFHCDLVDYANSLYTENAEEEEDEE